MPASDLTLWYVGFGVGAVCVFAVVVAVVVMLQRSADIGAQILGVVEHLDAISASTAAVPMVGAINADVRELNQALADTTELLLRLPGRAR